MNNFFTFFIFLLVLIAALIRDNFVFTLLYLFAGMAFFGRLWSERTIKALRYKRSFPARVFHGERTSVRLEVENSGILPAIWVRMVDSLPVEISPSSSVRRVFSIGGKDKITIRYPLVAYKRGRYPIGPIQFRTGDLFGLTGTKERVGSLEHITVYPKILPMPNFAVSSQIPLGSMAFHQPIFEDPNRFVGKRAYQVGDSLRRVDWKSTARTGQLQVKLYEPSISIHGFIFLSLNPDDYYHRRWIDATELAVITAASVASWLVEKRQAVGLATNGVDSAFGGLSPAPILPNKGRDQLMRILETLAVVGVSRTLPGPDLVRQESVHLSWGATVILISGSLEDDLFDALLQLRKRGLQVMVLLVGTVKDLQQVANRAAQAGMHLHHIFNEGDLRTTGALKRVIAR